MSCSKCGGSGWVSAGRDEGDVLCSHCADKCLCPKCGEAVTTIEGGDGLDYFTPCENCGYNLESGEWKEMGITTWVRPTNDQEWEDYEDDPGLWIDTHPVN